MKKEALNYDINNFNRSIKYSEELGNWFRNEFGSTTCYDICGYNFSRKKDAEKYLNGGSINHCVKIAERVAQKVNIMI